MLSIEQTRKLETKEEIIAELKEHVRVRDQMCSSLWQGIVNDECMEIANKCISLGSDRGEIGDILSGKRGC